MCRGAPPFLTGMGFAAGTAWLLVGLSGTPLLCCAGCPDVACGLPPCCNGDCNADGEVTTADAIYLLSYIFARGPEAAPIPPCRQLPATGQTGCYSDFGPCPCDPPTTDRCWWGQDGHYRAGCPAEGRFVDNGDGTVSDRCTGLMWEKELKPVTCEFPTALDYCETLDLAGYDDWRLPNVRELQSILDFGRRPAIDPVFSLPPAEFPHCWSSTTCAGSPEDVLRVSLDGQTWAYEDRGRLNSVLAVRGGGPFR